MEDGAGEDTGAFEDGYPQEGGDSQEDPFYQEDGEASTDTGEWEEGDDWAQADGQEEGDTPSDDGTDAAEEDAFVNIDDAGGSGDSTQAGVDEGSSVFTDPEGLSGGETLEGGDRTIESDSSHADTEEQAETAGTSEDDGKAEEEDAVNVADDAVNTQDDILSDSPSEEVTNDAAADADSGTGVEYGSDFVILVNGQQPDADLGYDPGLLYGKTASLALADGTGQAMTATDTLIISLFYQTEDQFGTEGKTAYAGTLRLAPGQYRLFYYAEDTTGTTTYSYDSLDNNRFFTLTVSPSQIAAPSGAGWKSTSSSSAKAVWTASTQTMGGLDLDSGAVAGYSLQLYRQTADGSGSGLSEPVACGDPIKVASSEASSGSFEYDFTSAIESAGEGHYSFTVQALSDDANLYTDSPVSSLVTDLYPNQTVPVVTSFYGNGDGAALTATFQDEGSGLAAYAYTTISGVDQAAEINWTTVPGAPVTAQTFPWTPGAGTDDNVDGAYYAWAKDAEGNIARSADPVYVGSVNLHAYYIDGTAAETDQTYARYTFPENTPSDSEGGSGDGSGSSESGSSEAGTGGSGASAPSYTVTLPTVDASTDRPGYVFDGWFEDSDYSGEEVSSLTLTGDRLTQEAYAKWSLGGITWAKSPTDTPESDRIKTYDGQEVTLEAAAAIGGASGAQVTYTWYRKADVEGQADVEVTGSGEGTPSVAAGSEGPDGGASSALSLKNVSDSGTYYAVARVTFEGQTVESTSDPVQVTISKRPVTVKPADRTVTYLDEAPNPSDYTMVLADGSKLADGETLLGDALTLTDDASVSVYSCAYQKGDHAGTSHDIAIDSVAWTAGANYQVTTDKGTLTVVPKDVTDDESVTVDLADSESQEEFRYTYTGQAITPAVTVSDPARAGLEGISEILSEIHSEGEEGDYSLAWANNTNVPASEEADAQPSLTVTFSGDYTGTKTLPFTIQKASYTPAVTIDKADDTDRHAFLYGEDSHSYSPSLEPDSAPADSPAQNAANVSWIYYRATLNEDGTITVGTEPVSKPVDAGGYAVIAHVSGDGNYNAADSDPYYFTIKPIPLTITTGSGTWVYDGNTHRVDGYTLTGNFYSGEGFRSVEIIGEVTEVTPEPVRNEVRLTYSSNTKEGNYDITYNYGNLIVEPALLTTPTTRIWDVSEPGTAEWVPVTKEGLEVTYRLQLQRMKTDASGNPVEDEEGNPVYENVGDPVDTTDVAYDFSQTIREGEAGKYVYTMQVLPTGGDRQNCYRESIWSDVSTAIYAVDVTVEPGFGTDSVEGSCEVPAETGSGTQTLVLTPGEDGRFARRMLSGESMTVTGSAQTGYAYTQAGAGWSVSDASTASLSGAAAGEDTHTSSAVVTIPTGELSSNSVTVTLKAVDEPPMIWDFRASRTEEGETAGREVTFTAVLSDTLGITAWAILTEEEYRAAGSNPELSPELWTQVVPGEGDSYPLTLPVSRTVSIDDITGDSGQYRIYLKDTRASGTVFQSMDSISVYKIFFERGDTTEAPEAMDPVLKIQNQVITLPANIFQKSGLFFANWLAEGTSNYYQDQAVFAENGSRRLVAQWSDLKYPYTVNYYLMELDEEGQPFYPAAPASTVNLSALHGTRISYDTEELQQDIEGYELDDDPASVTGVSSWQPSITLDRSGQVLNIYYKLQQHRLVYQWHTENDPEIVTTISDQTLYFGQDITEPAPEQMPAGMDGYTFTGWTYNTGSTPTTMPEHDVTATGVYSPKDATYLVNVWLQDLPAAESYDTPAGTYTLQSSTVRVGKHGETIYAAAADAVIPEGTDYDILESAGHITGFGLKGISVSEGPAEVTDSVSPQGNLQGTQRTDVRWVDPEALEDPENRDSRVCLNIYYDRTIYPLTLNVWKGQPDQAGSRNFFTNTWNIAYGTPLANVTEDGTGVDFAAWNQESWPEAAENADPSVDLTDYRLARYVNWSSGASAPETMPAGPVTVTREYVPREEEADYRVQVYYQEADGSYPAAASRTLTYRGTVGSTVSFGADNSEATLRESALNTLLRDDRITWNGKVLYDFDNQAQGSVLSGQVTADDGTGSYEPLTLKVYYGRTLQQAPVRYYYTDKEGNQTLIAEKTVEQIWGSSFDTDLHRFFYGDTSTDYTGEGWTTLNAAYAAKDYNFGGDAENAACICKVSYVTESGGLTRSQGTEGEWVTIPSSAEIEDQDTLEKPIRETLRADLGNYVNVYYTELDPDKYSFWLDVRFRKEDTGLTNQTIIVPDAPIVLPLSDGSIEAAEEGGSLPGALSGMDSLEVRVANDVFFYDGVTYEAANSNTGYLAAGYDPVYGHSTIKEGYVKVKVNGNDSITIPASGADQEAAVYNFFLGPAISAEEGSGSGEGSGGTDSALYLYLGAADNRFYRGNLASFVFEPTMPGYEETITALLTRYKEEATDDKKREGARVYHHSWGSAIVEGESGHCYVDFVYDPTYQLHFTLNSSVWTYPDEYLPGKEIDLTQALADFDALETNPFADQIPEGSYIAWYVDEAMTPETRITATENTKATVPKTSSGAGSIGADVRIYGKVARSTVLYDMYSMYMDPNGLTYEGETYTYLPASKTDLDAMVDAGVLTKEPAEKEVAFTDGLGEEKPLTLTTVTYKKASGPGAGLVLAVAEQKAVLADSNISYEPEDILPPDGYLYDDGESSNRSDAYIQKTPVDLYAYFRCLEYTLFIDPDNEKNTTEAVYQGGKAVTIPNPVKEGYVFDGWDQYLPAETGSGSGEGSGQGQGTGSGTGAVPAADIEWSREPAAQESLPASIAVSQDGTASDFLMPVSHLKLKAKWQPAQAGTIELVHLFQKADRSYGDQELASLRALMASAVPEGDNPGDDDPEAGSVTYTQEGGYTVYRRQSSAGSGGEGGEPQVQVIGATRQEGSEEDDFYTIYFYNAYEEGTGDGAGTAPETALIGAVTFLQKIQKTEGQETASLPVCTDDVLDEKTYIVPAYDGSGDAADALYEYSITVFMDHTGQTTDYTAQSQDTSVVYKPGISMTYYYSRLFDRHVRVICLDADGYMEEGSYDAGAVVSGGGEFYRGQEATLRAALLAGYEIVGWYPASRVLGGYTPDMDRLLSSYAMQEVPLDLSDPLSTETTFVIKTVDPLQDYVLLTRAFPVATVDTFTISGDDDFDYGYKESENRTLSASITFPEGTDTSKNYISSYQWYQVTGTDQEGNPIEEPIEGAVSASYQFPVGKEAGAYTYFCKAVIERSDNGRTLEVRSDQIPGTTGTSENFTVTVKPVPVPVTETSLEWTYDGTERTPSAAVVTEEDQSLVDGTTIYYSETELTPDQQARLETASWSAEGVTAQLLEELGLSAQPVSYKNVAVEVETETDPETGETTQTERIVPHTTWYYAVSSNTNYQLTAGSVTATVRPRLITLRANQNNAFTRVYDGTKEVSGAVMDPETDKYRLAHGTGPSGFYEIHGAVQGEVDYIIIDFDGEFNDKDVDDANQVHLTNIRVVRSENDDHDGERNYNYICADAYDFIIGGHITQRPLTVNWAAGEGGTVSTDEATGARIFSYIYDAALHAPTASLQADEGTVEKTEQVAIRVTGQQKNIGSYTAAAQAVSDVEGFKGSNYRITEASAPYQIQKRPAVVSADPAHIEANPLNGRAVYDGQPHTVDPDEFFMNDQNFPEGYTWGITISYQDANGNSVDAPLAAGTYQVIPSGFWVRDASGSDVTDNYDLDYRVGQYVVEPRPVWVLVTEDDTTLVQYASGKAVAEDKVYDTTTAAVIHNENLILIQAPEEGQGTGDSGESGGSGSGEGDSGLPKKYGVVAGETLAVTGVTGAFEDPNVSVAEGEDPHTGDPAQKIVNLDFSQAQLTGATAANYSLVMVTADGVTSPVTGLRTRAVISRAPLTITASGREREYDGSPLTEPGFTVNGLQGSGTNADVIDAGTDSGTGVTFTSASTITNVGQVPNRIETVTIHYTNDKAGVYDTVIFADTAENEEDNTKNARNYVITRADGLLKVTQNSAAIRIQSLDQAWVYDGQSHTYNTTDPASGQDQTGEVSSAYQVTVTAGSGTDPATDSLTPAAGEAGTEAEGKTIFTLPSGDKITITPADTAPLPSSSETGGGTVSTTEGNGASGVRIVADTRAGNNTFTYTITNPSGEDVTANYADVEWDYGTLSITKRPVTVAAVDGARILKTYDGTTSTKIPDGSGGTEELVKPEHYQFGTYDEQTESGLVSGETLTLTAFTSDYNWADATLPDELTDAPTDGATKVVMTQLSIDDSASAVDDNYQLMTEIFDIEGRIRRRPLTITVKDQTVTYGDPAPAWGAGTADDFLTVAGRVSGDAGSSLADLGITYTITCAYDPANTTDPEIYGVGSYAIVIGPGAESGSGSSGETLKVTNDSRNYSIANDDVTNGTLTVVPKELTVTPRKEEAGNAVFGDPVPAFAYDIDGFVRNETAQTAVSGNLAQDQYVTTYAPGTSPAGTYTITISRTEDQISAGIIQGLTCISTGQGGNPNYIFTTAKGSFGVDKKAITITGIAAAQKTYDGNNNAVINASAASCPEDLVFQTDGQTGGSVSYTNQADGSAVLTVTDLKLNNGQTFTIPQDESAQVTIAGTYNDVNVPEDKTVTFTGSLSSYLDARYVLEVEGSHESVIEKAPLSVIADDLTVVYGTPASSDMVSYTYHYSTQEGENFRNNEDESVLDTKPTAAGTYTDSPFYTKVGTYAEDIKASGAEDDNYTFLYTHGTLSVTQAKLATPSVAWDADNPGTVTWTGVDGIGDVAVHSYQAQLYRDGEKVEAANAATTMLASSDGDNTYHWDIREVIRAQGPGAYTVKVKAVPSTENNSPDDSASSMEGSPDANVAPSDEGESENLYAAAFTLTKASDAASQAGIGSLSFDQNTGEGDAKETRVLIAGESAPISASLANTTGYTVSAWTADKSITNGDAAVPAGTVANLTQGSLTQDGEGGTSDQRDAVTGSLQVTPLLNQAFTSEDPVHVALSLTPVPATLTVGISARMGEETQGSSSKTVDYGYQDPILVTAAANPAASDNVDAAGYDYTYQWYHYDPRTSQSTAILSAEALAELTEEEQEAYKAKVGDVSPAGDVLTFKTWNEVGTYRYYCAVTAVRKDNGQSAAPKNTSRLQITVNKGSFAPVTQIEGWTWGDARQEPHYPASFAVPRGLTKDQLESRLTTYWYYKASESQENATMTVPTEAGDYKVFARVAESESYQATSSQPVDFTIAQAKLKAPENLQWTASDTTTIGLLKWDPVTGMLSNEENTDNLKENAGASDSADTIQVTYDVKLYKKAAEAGGSGQGQEGTEDVLVKEYSGLTDCQVNASQDLNASGSGSYFFTVTAIAANTTASTTVNCLDSDLSRSAQMMVDAELIVTDLTPTQGNPDGHTADAEESAAGRVYNGYPYRFSMDLSGLGQAPEGSTRTIAYQWYRQEAEESGQGGQDQTTLTAIPADKGGTAPAFDVDDVADSGIYHCVVTVTDTPADTSGEGGESADPVVTTFRTNYREANVFKRPIAITAYSETKDYDGRDLKNTGYSAAGGVLLGAEQAPASPAQVELSDAHTGETPLSIVLVTASYDPIDSAGGTGTGSGDGTNEKFDKTEKISVTVTKDPADLTKGGMTAVNTPSGAAVSYVVSSQTSTSVDTTANYTFTYETGTLTVNKPVCKIMKGGTGGAAEDLLYYLDESDNNYYPAVYNTLQEAFTAAGNNGSAGAPASQKLYVKSSDGNNGDVYTEYAHQDGYQIEMLQNYTVPAEITDPNETPMTVTLTTASTTAPDGYVSIVDKAVLTKGAAIANASMLKLDAYLTLTGITLDGGSVGGSNDGGILYVNSGSVTVGSNAVLTTGSAANGGAIALANGTSAMLSPGGSITNTRADGSGGAIYAAGGATVTVNGGSLTNNTANTSGGAVYAASGAAVTVNGGNLTNNTANASGGAIYAAGGAAGPAVTVTAGTISGNRAAAGGAIYIAAASTGTDKETAVFSGGSITGNTTTGTAGSSAAVYAAAGSAMTFSGAPTISGNTDSGTGANAKPANVYFTEDTTARIRADGLTGGEIGIYVPDTALTGSDYSDLYHARGLSTRQFGTFTEDTEANKLSAFVNDRNGLRGMADPNAAQTIMWEAGYVTLTKEVTGTYGDKTREFSFAAETGGDYSILKRNAAGTAFEPVSADNTFTLKDGESITLQVPYYNDADATGTVVRITETGYYGYTLQASCTAGSVKTTIGSADTTLAGSDSGSLGTARVNSTGIIADLFDSPAAENSDARLTLHLTGGTGDAPVALTLTNAFRDESITPTGIPMADHPARLILLMSGGLMALLLALRRRRRH